VQIAGLLEWTKDSNNVNCKYTALDITEDGYKYSNMDDSGAACDQPAPPVGSGQSLGHKSMFL